MAALNIPFLYRVIFLYFEPFAALVGAGLAHFSPERFLATFTPTAVYAPSNQIIYDQVAATYFLFAFNEAVVLRVTNDTRVWKALLLGMLICDGFHTYASYIALGPTVFWDPTSWRSDDIVNFGALGGFGLLRAAFLLNIGLGRSTEKKVQ